MRHGGDEMLDDLDLAWEEHQEPRRRRGAPPSRQARQRRRKERGRRRRSFGALFISVLLLVALGGGVYWGLGKVQDYFGAPDYDSVGTTPVNVVVHPGDGSGDIANELYAKKVVKSSKAFVKAAQANTRSRNIQPGTYRLFVQMPAANALAMLLDPDKNMVVNKVTIPEGKSMFDTYQLLSKATGIPVAKFTEAAPAVLKKIPDFWFARSDSKAPIVSIEGFLFPDTYRLDPGMTAEQILQTMVDQFMAVATELHFTDEVQANLGGVTPFEALTVASLAQAEAFRNEDMGKIARVAYNRVYKEFACNCLQFDVTVNYYLQSQGKPIKASKDMLAAELDNPKNPWNTGASSKGLPRGPINSPGRAALQAAMNPTKGNWFYFVAVDRNGTTMFAETASQFNQLKLQACRQGIVACP
jgi:UPF0755 protein